MDIFARSANWPSRRSTNETILYADVLRILMKKMDVLKRKRKKCMLRE